MQHLTTRSVFQSEESVTLTVDQHIAIQNMVRRAMCEIENRYKNCGKIIADIEIAWRHDDKGEGRLIVTATHAWAPANDTD